MTASEIRALFAVASRPEVVSLAGGMPPPDSLPLELVSEIAQRLVLTDAAASLQYGSAQGDISVREAIVEVAAESGVSTHASDVVVTTGSQQALDLLARILLDPGDVVLVESPSYVGALGVFASYEARVRHLGTDLEGVVVEAARAAVLDERAAGRRVKMLYLVPTNQNPSGATLPATRRAELVALADELGILVIEDDPYGLLSFDGRVEPSMHSFGPSGVVYLGSFSKILAPGLRVGFAVAPPAIRDKLVLAAESAVLCPSAFSQRVVATYLRENAWREHVKGLRVMYRERCEALTGALSRYLPEAQWRQPTGGFFVWSTLPGDLEAPALLPRAVEARVAFVPGTAFFSDGQGRRHARLSFCLPPPAAIVEGVRRLAGAVADELELRAAVER
jgi:DNA-binding transcriptional MocR family regulator